MVGEVRIYAEGGGDCKATKKGQYHKTRHCPDLLRTIEPSKVRGACPHCMRLFRTLAESMGSTAFS